jgi:N-acetylmuramoyl-L-alanine amidase
MGRSKVNNQWLIDAGHGGVAFGHYLTAGKRSPGKKTLDDDGFFEGDINRFVAREVIEQVAQWSDDWTDIEMLNPGPIDIGLRQRIKAINKLAKHNDVCLISLHANASRVPGWSDANGFTVYHSKIASGQSILLAQIMEQEAAKNTDIKSRGIKKALHSITTLTKCPAILYEMFFMDNRHDVKLISSYEQIKCIAFGISETIRKFDVYA